jgi:hypothetical protein
VTTFPSGTYIGKYKGVPYYAKNGKYECLFGWMPKTFETIRQLKYNVTLWRKT